jgi:20S proteasome alpha/beta subunit
MTICIASICDRNGQVVAVADRMLTAADVEFEQEGNKIETMADRIAVLTAGSALRHVDLLRNVRNGVQNRRNISVADIVNELKKQFAELRQQRAEEQYLRPLGMTFDHFIQHQGRMPEMLALRLTANIEAAELDMEFIVAGVDQTGAHIYHVHDPGMAECFDAIGFCTMGSGERHASLTFIRAEYTIGCSLNQALFLAYQAKRDAEAAPGVGAQYTDIAVIANTGVRFVARSTMDALQTTYEERRRTYRNGQNDVQGRISEIAVEYVPEEG